MKAAKILLLVAATLMMADFAFAQIWTLTSAPTNYWFAVASSADGTKLVAVISGGRIYTSTNSGVTWKATSSPSNYWTTVASSADGTRLVAGGDGNISPTKFPIYTSINSGGTWKSNNTPANVYWTSVASSADGTKLAAADFDDGAIYTTVNSGLTWKKTGAPIKNWITMTSSTNGNKLVAGTSGDGIYISSNSGLTWKQSSAPSGHWFSIASSWDGARLVAGNEEGALYTSTNSGATWIQRTIPTEFWTSISSSASGTILMAEAGHPGMGPIFTSADAGLTWKAGISGQLWLGTAMSADGTKMIASVADGGIYTSYYVPAPSLNMTMTNGKINLSWVLPTTNFVVQQSSNLTTWVTLTNIPALNTTSLLYQVVLSKSNSNCFYRLKTP